ncbi:hypothetical protein AAFP35_17445 [Gordonia sp. CPCC 206044]|uniref:hypothetical protein n=1 Tax=Gordonia sp. CPCC 206044 TaxID=3140793 RepID=UPI003AF3AD1B
MADPHQFPPRPASTHPDGSRATTPVSVRGTAPPSWKGFIIIGAFNGAVALTALVCLAAGVYGGAAFAGGFLVLFGGPCAVQFLVARSRIGKPYITAGPEGLWANGFTLRWDEIRALDFITAFSAYRTLDQHTTQATREKRCSLVVTKTATDQNGRPIQIGQTMPVNHTHNYDEFRSAVRAFAPHIEFWSSVRTSHYVADQTIRNAMLQELSTTGVITVRDKRGVPKFVLDPAGVMLENGVRLPWTDVAGLTAVTDLHTTNSGALEYTESTHRLVLATRFTDPGSGRRIDERPVYDLDFQPPLEQVLPLVQQWAPHLGFADNRQMAAKPSSR